MFIEYYFIYFLNIFRLALFSFQCNIYISWPCDEWT